MRLKPPFPILAGLALAACQHPINWPSNPACSPPADSLLAEVTSVLAKDEGKPLTQAILDALDELARSHGADVVECAIEAIADAASPATSAASPTPSAASLHAKEFLKEKGTRP